MTDRVSERRRAAQLARHYRDQEGLTIAEIARRLGRAEGTVKAYLYDPIGEMARAVHRDRSVRELGGRRRRRLRRRLNAWASIASVNRTAQALLRIPPAPATSSRSPAGVVAADLKERKY